MRTITDELLSRYKQYLINEEKSLATIKKYTRDVRTFSKWQPKNDLAKADVLQYKSVLIQSYSPASVNSMLSSLNSFFSFMNWYDLRVKNLKVQRQLFTSGEKELSKDEYERLLQAAKEKSNQRLYLLLQTICSTGIRVSEVRYITAESVACGVAEINCKGKRRQVFLPGRLCQALEQHLSKEKIQSGPVFVTKYGNPLDRSNIWLEIKKLCKHANVCEKKVFPHNLRHLFARTYYESQKDIVRLADILGHSSINTTRIYTTESGEIHRKQLQQLGLLLC